jgi:hypothetical protein
MKLNAQLIARLSVLCYLFMASIAAAHAFPMPSAGKDVGGTVVVDITTKANPAQTPKVTAAEADIQLDCHQAKAGVSNAKSMSLCKIFCSATGHALATDIFVGIGSITPPLQVASLSDISHTRQLSVEQHPPQ